ncbi:hypothetical protein JG687_00005709 [Phytophthora cactorum]|uniref:Uncharacterized protein n=1 Tax=Phytophthora cactorum TaxID=29920 RepID=A0A8T1UK41_9STRA|nr:hypothetical protein JG687_00005709 [Phytophthora cactorum]
MDRKPDDTVHGAIDGILDERWKGSKMAPKGGTQPLEICESHSRVVETIDELRDTTQDGHNLLEIELRNLSRAKVWYYDIKCREELLRLNTAYNLGNLTGVITAAVSSVHCVIHLARTRDRPSTSDEAFAAVSTRLTDVFASALATTLFPSDPDYGSDAPSEDFASTRIETARENYYSAIEAAQSRTIESNRDLLDPEPPILEPTYQFFGRPQS